MEPTESLPEPSSDEKTLAMLAHVLQVVSWFIAPLVILLIKRESRFVRFHALQVLLLHLAYIVVFAALMGLFFVFAIGSLPAGDSRGPPPPALMGSFFVFWCGMATIWILMIVLAIVYGIRAGRGEWAAYPIVGRWALRLTGN